MTQDKSIFAVALKALLDETNLFDRREWAQFLSVSESAISQWVGDKTIPRADLLYMIIDVLEESTDVFRAPLESFKTIAQRAAIEVSPHGRRMLPTIWAYLTRPAFSGLSNTLARLSPEEQAKVLFDRYEKPKARAASPLDLMHVYSSPNVHIPAPSLAATSTEGLLKPFFPCSRAEKQISCANWEVGSWQGTIAPTFRVLTGYADQTSEQKPREWWEILEYPRILIRALPGTGKTSFLLHLAQSAGRRVGGPLLPVVYLHLGCLSSINTTEELSEICGKTLPPEASMSRMLLLLDAFDEVPYQNRPGLAEVIAQFEQENPTTRLIMTSRPTPDLAAFDWMTALEILPPSPANLLSWVRQELSERSQAIRKEHQSLQTFVVSLRERPDVFKELQNPLFLSHCTMISQRHSLTANHDVEMFQECVKLLLEDWDKKKNIVRVTNAWARPSHLFQWLSGLCYQTLMTERADFTSQEVESWAQKYTFSEPIDEILRILSETTGLVHSSGSRKWSITHKTFQEYLAARFIIDSSSDATLLVKELRYGPRAANVLKFACAATNDASRLLDFALTTEWQQQDDKMATLADIMAQQLNASTDLIKRGCHQLTDWLDASFDGWETTTIDDSEQISPPMWKLAARQTRGQSVEPQGLVRALQAVHRARLGPAKAELSEALRASSSDVVRAVGDSLEVDGYLQARMVPHHSNSVLVAEVLAA